MDDLPDPDLLDGDAGLQARLRSLLKKESKPGCLILPQEYFIISISPKSQGEPFYMFSMRTAFSGNVLLREHDASDGEWIPSMARIATLGIPT